MARELVMGIDIGSSAVKTVIAEKNKDSASPSILGAGISQSHGLRKGSVINPHDVSLAIKNSVKKAQAKTGINIKQAFISIGGSELNGIRSKGSIAVSRADREISENDVKRAIHQSEVQLGRNASSYLLNRDVVHFFPMSYRVDEEQIIGDPVGLKGEKLEVETLFITSPNQHLNSLIKSVELAGITIQDIIADSWAMSHILLSQKEKEVGCFLINIGGETTTLMVLEEGGPVSMEISPIGSNHITYDIAQGFQVLLDEAEQLKISYGSDSATKKRLSAIIEPRLKDIFELAENHLTKIKRVKLLPGGIMLTGGGANLPGIEEIAKKSLKLPVQLNRLNLSGDTKNDFTNPVWSVALGLCFMGLNQQIGSTGPNGIGGKTKNKMLKWFKNFLP